MFAPKDRRLVAPAACSAPVGQLVPLGAKPATIIGILPKGFRFVYTDYDLVAPRPGDLPREESSLSALAGLQAGVSVTVARQSMAAGQTNTVTPYPQLLFPRSL